MKKLTAILVTLVLGCFASESFAQKATEIFIPVGKSPGVSGIYSVIGKINDIKTDDNSLNMSTASRSYSVKMAENTQIWLDRSKLKMTNKKGSFSDLKNNLTIEVMFPDKEHKGEVVWVKIQIENSGG